MSTTPHLTDEQLEAAFKSAFSATKFSRAYREYGRAVERLILQRVTAPDDAELLRAYTTPVRPRSAKACPWCGVRVPVADPCERPADYCSHGVLLY